MVKKSFYGNTYITVIIHSSGTIGFSVRGEKPTTFRNNIYDALSDYGVGYDAAKEIGNMFLKEQLPEIKVTLKKEHFKGHDFKISIQKNE